MTLVQEIRILVPPTKSIQVPYDLEEVHPWCCALIGPLPIGRVLVVYIGGFADLTESTLYSEEDTGMSTL
jgi:hypothetical protein